MNYELKVGEKTYELKLTTRDLVKLEERLGCHPLLIFGKDVKNPEVPKISQLLTIIECSFHDKSTDEIYDIVDAWIEDGHSQIELNSLVQEIFEASGVYREKNS